VDTLDIARWQFGITTVYHFIFVPLTIGLAPLVAIMQTAWVRTGNERWLRLTKFFGKLMLINFAIGVATGIVQEFQFGMAWSEYSRFVGDVFGAPLAMEALIAFFLESVFLGLWIFGWGRLSPKVHCAVLWLVAFGTLMSAYFILAANSWMQHPVGYEMSEDGRARLTDIWAVLTNPTQLVTFPHTISGAIMTGGALMFGISAWQLARSKKVVDIAIYRMCFKIGAITVLIGTALVTITGDIQAKIMTEQQPMKMAAAEALFNTSTPASFSIFTIGTPDGTSELFGIRIPNLLSFLATGSFSGTVEGINDIRAQYQEMFRPGDYRPVLWVTYWGFRYMIGFGLATAAVALIALWLLHRGSNLLNKRWAGWIFLAAIFGPLLANSAGWIFTEMGRQPWVVFGRMFTRDGVSLAPGSTEMLISIISLTVLYGILALVDVGLMTRYAKAGPPSQEEVQDSVRPPKPPDPGSTQDADADRPLVFAY